MRSDKAATEAGTVYISLRHILCHENSLNFLQHLPLILLEVCTSLIQLTDGNFGDLWYLVIIINNSIRWPFAHVQVICRINS